MVPGSLFEFLVTLGLPALVVLFFAEGLVLGKLLQPPVVFVAYVAGTHPGSVLLALLVGSCVVAATLGQWTLYRGFHAEATELVGIRRTVPYLDSLPARVQRRIGRRRMVFVDRLFGEYGAVALCLTNAVPGIRGLMTVPAGLSGYPVGRFVLASAIGNVLYFGLLIAAASGVSWIAGLFL